MPLVARLLAHAASGAPLGLQRWQSECPADAGRQLQWLMAGGLGPLLHHANSGPLPAEWRDALLAADLTARVTHGNAVDTVLELIEVCEGLQVQPTLLKGISVSEELYPAEHLRPMGDIDVLLPAEAVAAFESALLARGYERLDYPLVPGQHHGAPLRDPRRRTFVEPHTLLFPDTSPLRSGATFSAANVAARAVASHYHGRPVRRLGKELQLVYIASSWFDDLTRWKVQPSYIATLFDAVYLLRSFGPTLDWVGMLEWLDNELAQASLYAMLTYLPRHGVEPAPSAVLARLAAQRLVGPVQLRLIHAMLDRYLIAGRHWDRLLPPPVPARYSLPHQFEKRVLAPLRRFPAYGIAGSR